MGILETSLCVYVYVVVEDVYTCKTDHFGNKTLFFVCFVVEGMYTCKIGSFLNEPLCLC